MLYSQEYKLDQTIKNDTSLYVFNNHEIIGSLHLNAKIQLNKENSLIRVILVDMDLTEWLIYESYHQIAESNISTVNNVADETELLNNVHPKYIKIQIIDASLTIKSLLLGSPLTNQRTSTIETDQKTVKETKNRQKIDQLNKFLLKNGKKWIAGETGISNLCYEKKKEIFGKEKYNSNGLEYYIGGIFEIKEETISSKSDRSTLSTSMVSSFIDHFDWREKHGANLTSSPYYDGDITGGGWFTPVKTQWCGNCWAYGAVGEAEVIANLYYNKHLDFDLSETELTSCYGLGNDCNGGWISNGLKYIVNSGVVNENCFPAPLDYIQHPCTDKCPTPTERLKISGYTRNNVSNEDDLKKLIIKSPVAAMIDCTILRHAMVLCGYHKINENDSLYYLTNNTRGWIKILSGDPLIGKTYWIFKNSYGLNSGNSGYYYFVLESLSLFSTATQICAAITPITSLNYSINDIRCVDLDGDGYFNWGIGPKPAFPVSPLCSPNEEDGDDSNPNLGPMDEYGNCAIISSPYVFPEHQVTSIETWQNTYSECGAVVVKNGGNLTISGATINLEGNATFSAELGSTLTFNSGTIQ